MLTPEQIKNLNNGDKLLVQGEFVKAHDNGSILVSLSTKAWESSIHELLFFHPSSVSLPSEHGTSVPTTPRLFQKGDKVRVVAWNGRDIDRMGQIGRVVSDEYNSRVELAIDGWSSCIYYPACHLELVTPVEELEPYSVRESDAFDIVREGKIVMTIPFTEDDYYTFKQAEAAAEAECARLNEEWRKEHQK